MALRPCAACKVLNSSCTMVPPQECIFAPFFPSTEPEKFDRVHRVFGAENVYKILANVKPWERETAVSSLCYEAEARIQDPISGYVGMQSILENFLNSLKEKIDSTKKELAAIVGPEKVPQFSEFLMSGDVLNTPASLFAFIDGMEELTEAHKYVLKQLPFSTAKGIVRNIVTNREDEEMVDVPGAAGASTSAGPSVAAGSTGNTQRMPPQNQNKP